MLVKSYEGELTGNTVEEWFVLLPYRKITGLKVESVCFCV